MWLARSARGRGIGVRALAAVVGTARSLGYAELRAETSSGNRPALAVLTAAGFVLDPPDEAGVVVARLALTAPKTVAGG
jgi:RimJ/RimL family protein N-acetyltransferase